MIITGRKTITTSLYDSVLGFGIEYDREHNKYICRMFYGAGVGEAWTINKAIGDYIIRKLQAVDINRKSWRTTDGLIWSAINTSANFNKGFD